MNARTSLLFLLLGLGRVGMADETPASLSGIYPDLAMFNREGECGTGAVVTWADRLWVITYSPHMPKGSSDKLYEITPDLHQIIRPESIGGTPANRMFHRESQQLFIGPYAIDRDRRVRVIPYRRMFGRLTGIARHLSDPADKVVYATMEEGVYEVDVKTLEVKELWADEQRATGRKAGLPGYHGKGFYSAQGRYVYANNGDHAAEALLNPATPSGVLAEWDGSTNAWRIVRRNQFTEVTGPGGIEGNAGGDDRLWSIGWDHRSLILMLLENGAWHSYRLPKASYCYDGAHGWNTEWPRIRDIGDSELLMTMHGAFWKFPRSFSATNSAGLAQRSTYLKVIGDFCRWNDRVVFGCDDSAKNEFLNTHPLKGNIEGSEESQSNLWFVEPSALDHFGPRLGRGGVWLRDDLPAGARSEPFLFSGFDHRSLYLSHGGTNTQHFTLEVDRVGRGVWEPAGTIDVQPGGTYWHTFQGSETGAWVRLQCTGSAKSVTAWFEFRDNDLRATTPDSIFSGLASCEAPAQRGLLHVTKANHALRLQTDDASYELDGALHLRATSPTDLVKVVSPPAPLMHRDAASAFYLDPAGKRWRFPVASPLFDVTGGVRVCREVCTERNLVNAFGTFFEMPADNAGGFARIRPIASHAFRILDFTSYRGLLVMSGVSTAPPTSSVHIVRSGDGRTALWVGVVDDLWKLGKARGRGGPWMETPVTPDAPSDPYLLAGYDHKMLTLSHDALKEVHFTLEVDLTGNNDWVTFGNLAVQPGAGEKLDLGACAGSWIRFRADTDCRATAQLDYD